MLKDQPIPDLSGIWKVRSNEHARAAEDEAIAASEKTYREVFASADDHDEAMAHGFDAYLKVFLRHLEQYGANRDN
jgi:DNA topoisomerase IB